MPPDTENTLLTDFTKELVELEQSGAALPFLFTPSEAWYLMSGLQLLLRHPTLEAGSPMVTGFLRGLAENIEERLCNGRPAMTEVAQRGWDRAYDE